MVAANRVELKKMYKACQIKKLNKLISLEFIEMEKAVAKKMYNCLGPCHLLEMKVISDTKNDYSDNWEFQFLWIPLEQQAEKKMIQIKIWVTMMVVWNFLLT